jgi:hypothetical protein
VDQVLGEKVEKLVSAHTRPILRLLRDKPDPAPLDTVVVRVLDSEHLWSKLRSVIDLTVDDMRLGMEERIATDVSACRALVASEERSRLEALEKCQAVWQENVLHVKRDLAECPRDARVLELIHKSLDGQRLELLHGCEARVSSIVHAEVSQGTKVRSHGEGVLRRDLPGTLVRQELCATVGELQRASQSQQDQQKEVVEALHSDVLSLRRELTDVLAKLAHEVARTPRKR